MGGRWERRVARCRNPTEGFFSSGETPSWLQSQGKEGMGMEVGNENAGFDHYGWGERLAVRWGVHTLGGMERCSDRLISKCLHFKSEASPGYFIPRVDYFQTSPSHLLSYNKIIISNKRDETNTFHACIKIRTRRTKSLSFTVHTFPTVSNFKHRSEFQVVT